MDLGVRRIGRLSLRQQTRVGFLHHLLAEVDEDQVILEDAVVEHVLGRFTQVDDPLGQGRRLDAIRHLLSVDRTGGMVVATDAANAAGDEVGVARVLALHKDAVAAEHGRRTVAVDHLAVGEIHLGVDSQVPHDPADGIPTHVDDVGLLVSHALVGRNLGCHLFLLLYQRGL